MTLFRSKQQSKGRGRRDIMNHIDEFSIHQFRGIRDLKLEGLGQVNLLVGDNNSGKTSVLEALSIFCDSLNWRKWSNVASMREVGPLSSLSQSERLTWLFPQGEEYSNNDLSKANPEILLSASGSFRVKKVSALYEKFSEIIQVRYPRTGEGETTFEERDREVEGIKIHVFSSVQTSPNTDEVLGETFVFPNNRPLSTVRKQEIAILPVQIINPSSHRLGSTSLQLWTDVINAETKSDAIKLLRSFDPDIQDVDIIIGSAERPTVSVKHKKLRRAPLSTFGDGLRRIFTLAAAIPSVREGLLLVDELEMAIHTGALEKTFDWLVKACTQNKVQLFATTHSLETVDAILNAVGENVELVVYRLRKSGDTIMITSFNKELLTQLRNELGLEIR